MVHHWLQSLRDVRNRRAVARRERDRLRFGVVEAEAARRQFRWAEAAAVLRTYLRRRPRDAGAVVRLADVLLDSGDIEGARAALSRGLAHAPANNMLTRRLDELDALEPASSDYKAFRSGWTPPPPPVEPAGTSDGRLVTEPAVELLPHAAEWLAYALAVSGAAAVFADHEVEDATADEWAPAFHAAAHPDDLATTPRPPVAAMFAHHAAPASGRDLREALLDAFEAGPVVHLPMVLARAQARTRATPRTPAANAATDAAGADRLLVMVPTRDEGVVLSAMVESLKALADDPARLDFVVIDNGSRDPATLALLETWRTSGAAEVLRIDAPFNWADLNNRAAAGRTQGLFLFINNDMRMRTPGWDARVRAHLNRPSTGVVGARLLYPAGNVQHAGLALGVGGSPLHEGLGAGAGDHGPLDRWVRTRPAAAVTGAFLAVRRETFETVGGFDAAHFPVSCNDVDFCLRVRERGLTVLYAADIELTHDESHTRGHDDSEPRRRRAEAEKAALVRIWGADAVRDPARNPHWVAHRVLIFHGFRRPTLEETLAALAPGLDVWRTRRLGDDGQSTPTDR